MPGIIESVKADQLAKVDDKTFSITEKPTVRRVGIAMLKQQRTRIAARLAAVDSLIAEADKLGVR